ncbi:transducin beta-like protein 2 isoform X2 [Nematostella vectensis]|uniref:transducin beta-like protein 2 isoform X2 n=1 Tax=Nematostella vectensis TaxID=45351 RepID=UPI0020772068|nr:transducin beta-like protein 2 isoform X2 [Nematostella vectensis]
MADSAGFESAIGVIAISACLGAVILAIFVFVSLRNNSQDENSASDSKEKREKSKEKPQNGTKSAKGKKRNQSQGVMNHRRQFAALKGHTSEVLDLDFSLNGKLLASTSQDRTVRLWSVKDFKEKEHKYVRANVDFDHATKVNFSPDSSEDIAQQQQQQQPLRFRAFITALANGNTIRVFKVSKKKDGTGTTITGEFDFPVRHKAEIINIAVASNGKYIMSCSKDTTIIIWDLKGEVLATLDTLQINNSFSALSPCGRFVASAGFTPDVKLWEVKFNKSDAFEQVSRAMELKGHTAGIYHFSFSADSKRMATVSKDSTWRVWDIDVEYTKQQDPALLMTGIYDASCNMYDNMLISISPDAYVTAISMGRCIALFNTENGNLEELLQDVHGDTITAIAWHPSSRYLASAGGSDRQIRVWHNAAGIKVQIDDLKGKLVRAKSDTIRGRIEQQILEASASLDELNV